MTSPALLCDEMLGKLARWLRFMGVDVAYVKDLGDDGVLAAARADRRVLVTRDVELATRAAKDPGSLLLTATDPSEQLRDVVARLDLAVDRDAFLSRCSACNGVLEPADLVDVKERVPDGVAARHDAFMACDGCGKVYWSGTHVDRITAQLDALEES